MLDLLIIGAGPCGLFAAFYAGMNNLKAEVIESLPHVGGQLTTIYPEKFIYDIPGFKKIKAKEYIETLYDQYQQFSKEIPLHLSTSFTKIEKGENSIKVSTNRGVFETRTLLITSGNGDFTPRKLAIDNTDNFNNISYILSPLESYKDKKVVVLGGGDSALDFAILLQQVTNDVTIVHRRNDFRAHENSIQTFKDNGGIILTPYSVKEILGTDNKASMLILESVDNNQTLGLKCDEVVVCYGFLPSKIDYNAFGIECTNLGISVNNKMETSLSNIFAAGNCVNYPGKVKTIIPGMGEVITAIQSINNIINPNKKPTLFSSVLMDKK